MEALALVFVQGVASAGSPCLLPLYPSFLAYLSGNAGALAGRRGTALLGLVVLSGLLTAMVAFSLVLSALAIPVGRILSYAIPLIDGVLLLLGVLLLIGRNPFQRLPSFRVPIVGGPFGTAYLYGLLLGPLALPCAGPFLVATLAISIGLAEGLARVGTFLVYGLGFGLPLVLLSFAARSSQDRLVRWIARHHRALDIAAGVLLITAALVDLALNRENLVLAFG